MRKLTDEQIEYINDKKPPRIDGMVITRGFAEIILGGDIDIEFLKNSPYFIDRPVLHYTNA